MKLKLCDLSKEGSKNLTNLEWANKFCVDTILNAQWIIWCLLEPLYYCKKIILGELMGRYAFKDECNPNWNLEIMNFYISQLFFNYSIIFKWWILHHQNQYKKEFVLETLITIQLI